MASVVVREAVAGDLELLSRFEEAMALETEGRRLEPRRLREGVAAALADPSRGSFRVAELGGGPVGCLMVTREWSDWRNGWFIWIQSVYVEPAVRRRGVYRALHQAVLAQARAAPDVCGVRLYVDEGNLAAQATYERLGMARARYSMLEVDFSRPADR